MNDKAPLHPDTPGSPDVAATRSGISAVIPAYNCEGTIDEVVRRVGVVLAATGGPFEVVLVNDGSRDRTWEAVRRLSAEYPWVRGIDLMRNYGQHNALLCGIREARFAVTVTLDDDLQNPPEEIPRLLAKIDEGYDVVYGAPEKEQHGLFRDAASQITKLVLQKAMGLEAARNISAFRAFRTELRKAFLAYRSPFVSIDVLLSWGGARFTALRVAHAPRTVGASNYTFVKLLVHALNMMTGFSTVPLQLASLTGFLFTLVGIAVFGYVVIRYIIQGGSVPGFPFLASAIAIFSGAQLFALGIIGEYLARIHFRTMEQPTYTIRSQAGADFDPSDAGSASPARSNGDVGRGEVSRT